MHEQVKILIERYPALAPMAPDVDSAISLLVGAFRSGNKLLIAGNGGSAANADHISGELLKGFARQRPLSASDRDRLGDDLADNLQGGLPVVPITQLSAALTAFANDCDGDYAFAQMVWALGGPGDVFMAISTSGNSKNVVHAAMTARRSGLKVLGLAGPSGGALKDLSDVAICSAGESTAAIQEHHLPIYHCLCLAVEDEIFPDVGSVENRGPA